MVHNKKIILMLIAGSLHAATALADEFVKTDRYTLTSIDATGDQKAPLTTVVTMSFGADVRTVGEAILELLNGSGYRWELHANDQSLNTLPLPSVVRTLGPIRLNDALATIAGYAWVLKIDELHRVIWFDVSNHTVSTND